MVSGRWFRTQGNYLEHGYPEAWLGSAPPRLPSDPGPRRLEWLLPALPPGARARVVVGVVVGLAATVVVGVTYGIAYLSVHVVGLTGRLCLWAR